MLLKVFGASLKNGHNLRITRSHTRTMAGASPSDHDDLITSWTQRQIEIAERVNYGDNTDWSSFFTSAGYAPKRDLFIAGADISFSTTVADYSIGSLTVVKLLEDGSRDFVYSHSQPVTMPHPYVPSFLGFREAPVVSQMLASLPKAVKVKVDCLLLDGNGVLHPRKAGLACQVGVEEDLPTIGVSKALLCVDGLDGKEIRRQAASAGCESIDVVGKSDFVWAKAIMTGNAQNKPIYVSVGHRVSLTTAARLITCLCEFRVPAPIRFADMHSRAFLRDEKVDIYRAEAFL